MPTQKNTSDPLSELPPKLPTELAELDRVISLLSAISKGDMPREAKRKELHGLIGVIPKAPVAKLWKIEIKRIRGELADEIRAESSRELRDST